MSCENGYVPNVHIYVLRFLLMTDVYKLSRRLRLSVLVGRVLTSLRGVAVPLYLPQHPRWHNVGLLFSSTRLACGTFMCSPRVHNGDEAADFCQNVTFGSEQQEFVSEWRMSSELHNSFLRDIYSTVLFCGCQFVCCRCWQDDVCLLSCSGAWRGDGTRRAARYHEGGC